MCNGAGEEKTNYCISWMRETGLGEDDELAELKMLETEPNALLPYLTLALTLGPPRERR